MNKLAWAREEVVKKLLKSCKEFAKNYAPIHELDFLCPVSEIYGHGQQKKRGLLRVKEGTG
jgi:hypothetical protein